MVEERAWSLAGPGDWIFNEKLVPIDQVAGITRGEPTDDTRLSWVVVAVKQSPDPLDELSPLAERLERKVSQVRRRAQGAKGIILVRSWLGRTGALGNGAAQPTFEKIRSKILAVHADLAGVLVIERGHDQKARPFFGGVWIEGRDGEPLREFFDRLRLDEHRRDVLDDWD